MALLYGLSVFVGVERCARRQAFTYLRRAMSRTDGVVVAAHPSGMDLASGGYNESP